MDTNRFSSIVELVDGVLRSSGTAWRIDELLQEITVRGCDATINDVRCAVWQLIDDVRADLTPDRRIVAHQDIATDG